ncbi:hypothetical protein CPC08DRAFT_648380 [Agrocybe pediades]|nr:hypothetical protein CPC08DRAFT_648380 [Agrocybe pediades]
MSTSSEKGDTAVDEGNNESGSHGTIKCRCRYSGDVTVDYRPSTQLGPIIQCDGCDHWHHIACQQDGRVHNLLTGTQFICDECLSSTKSDRKQPQRESHRKKITTCTGMNKPLAERLRAGHGALARLGEFWYPVRLIKQEGSAWRVQYWRENHYQDWCLLASTPRRISLVDTEDHIDSLWNDREGQRKIRLGKWVHAHSLPSNEKLLSDPSLTTYREQVDELLMPFIDDLRSLYNHQLDRFPDDRFIPALKWLRSTGKPLWTTPIPAGSIPVTEQAQIMSCWFKSRISKNPDHRSQWIGKLPLGHAFTLYMVALMAYIPNFNNISEEKFWQAWNFQNETIAIPERMSDIEKKCIQRLEEEMFEISTDAGIASHYQWGLDVGHHQGNWNPYSGLPDEWNHQDYGSIKDDVLRVSLSYYPCRHLLS